MVVTANRFSVSIVKKEKKKEKVLATSSKVFLDLLGLINR